MPRANDTLDVAGQVLLDKDSLPNLVGFEIDRFVRGELGAPLFLENDGACFALGEALQGAGQGASSLVASSGRRFGTCWWQRS